MNATIVLLSTIPGGVSREFRQFSPLTSGACDYFVKIKSSMRNHLPLSTGIVTRTPAQAKSRGKIILVLLIQLILEHYCV